jgi:hypothetical protein
MPATCSRKVCSSWIVLRGNDGTTNPAGVASHAITPLKPLLTYTNTDGVATEIRGEKATSVGGILQHEVGELEFAAQADGQYPPNGETGVHQRDRLVEIEGRESERAARNRLRG